MNWITYLESETQLPLFLKSNIKEVILEHQQFSRLGQLDTLQLQQLLGISKKAGFQVYLQWDILSTEKDFQKTTKLLSEIPLEQFDGIRVQDVGAAEWCKTHHPHLPLHWIVETGNHNLPGLQQWIEYFQPNRLILSNELPGSIIQRYCQELPTPCEMLALGRLLLFYSPRHLLSPVLEETPKTEFIERIISAEEGNLRKFPVIENQHGSFMFHHSDLFLLDQYPTLQQTELSALRFDFRSVSSSTFLPKVSELLQNYTEEKAASLRKQWPVKTTHGFFRANRSERPISLLKNRHLRDRGESLVASIIEVKRREYMALHTRKSFACGDILRMITPEGQEAEIEVNEIRTPEGNKVQVADSPGIWVLPHVRYATARTMLYETTPLQQSTK